MTKKEFNLIKEVINERIKLDDIDPADNRHELINNRVMDRLFNCLRKFMLLVVCMMSLKVWKKNNCESYTINSDIKEWY